MWRASSAISNLLLQVRKGEGFSVRISRLPPALPLFGSGMMVLAGVAWQRRGNQGSRHRTGRIARFAARTGNTGVIRWQAPWPQWVES
jgi:hypothetical protein